MNSSMRAVLGNFGYLAFSAGMHTAGAADCMRRARCTEDLHARKIWVRAARQFNHMFVDDLRRLRHIHSSRGRDLSWLDEALNSGDGSYWP